MAPTYVLSHSPFCIEQKLTLSRSKSLAKLGNRTSSCSAILQRMWKIFVTITTTDHTASTRIYKRCLTPFNPDCLATRMHSPPWSIPSQTTETTTWSVTISTAMSRPMPLSTRPTRTRMNGSASASRASVGWASSRATAALWSTPTVSGTSSHCPQKRSASLQEASLTTIRVLRPRKLSHNVDFLALKSSVQENTCSPRSTSDVSLRDLPLPDPLDLRQSLQKIYVCTTAVCRKKCGNNSLNSSKFSIRNLQGRTTGASRSGSRRCTVVQPRSSAFRQFNSESSRVTSTSRIQQGKKETGSDVPTK